MIITMPSEGNMLIRDGTNSASAVVNTRKMTHADEMNAISMMIEAVDA
jgi:hypothetical protein